MSRQLLPFLYLSYVVYETIYGGDPGRVGHLVIVNLFDSMHYQDVGIETYVLVKNYSGD